MLRCGDDMWMLVVNRSSSHCICQINVIILKTISEKCALHASMERDIVTTLYVAVVLHPKHALSAMSVNITINNVSSSFPILLSAKTDWTKFVGFWAHMFIYPRSVSQGRLHHTLNFDHVTFQSLLCFSYGNKFFLHFIFSLQLCCVHFRALDLVSC